jgi:serine/threonine protein kinase
LQLTASRDTFSVMLAPDSLICNRYRVVRPIGQGGMGAVYEALDQRLRSRVALKQTLIDGTLYSDAFEHEAQLLANLRHPALPKVSDYFSDAEGQFLVMEYIAGDDLGSLLSRLGKPFPFEAVSRWADQLLDALDYLHTQEHPIIHRDIKPQNLKLTPRGEIILLDFGLAKGSFAHEQAAADSKSVYGYTPQYAPLEQVKGTGTDARSDLYSLGATLYHLLTGSAPPSAVARASDVLNRLPDPLLPAHAINREVPAAVSLLLSQAMAIESRRRFASAAAMRAALRSCAEPQTARATAPATDPVAAQTTNPVAPPATSPASFVADTRAVAFEQQPGEPAIWPPPLAQPLPSSQTPKRLLWWLAGGALLLVILATLLIWQLSASRNTANAPAGQSGAMKSTATTGATYPVMLVADGEAPVKDDLYKVLSARLERYASDKLVLRLTVRLLHNTDGSINYWDDSFRLIVDGAALAPTKAPNLVVSPYAAMDAQVEFVIPESVSQAMLQVGQVGRETNVIPLDLSARRNTAEIKQAPNLFQGMTFPVTLASGAEARAGDAVFKILSAQLDRYSTDRLAFECQIHFTNNSPSSVNLWDDSFRVLIDGVPFAPVKAPNLVVAPQSDAEVRVVFAIPDTITGLDLQVGQVGRQTNTISIALKP